MSITSEIERIKTNIANAYTELENKGATIPTDKNSNNLASTITTVTGGGGGGSTPDKGLVFEWDSNGYPTKIKAVGFTDLPEKYLVGNTQIATSQMDYFYKSLPEIDLSGVSNSLGISSLQGITAGSIKLSNTLKKINNSAFYMVNYDKSDVVINIPESVTEMGTNCFAYSRVVPRNFPNLSSLILPTNTFYYHQSLTSITLPSNIMQLSAGCFQRVRTLKEITLLRNGYISFEANSFNFCDKLEKVVMPNIDRLPALVNTGAFTSSGIANKTGYIYVPDELVESMKTATNWSTYASQIKGISELPTE